MTPTNVHAHDRFTLRYCELRIFLFRPSPQVTQPSPRAAEICYDAAAHIIKLSREQVEKGAIDVTWIFLMNLYMSINVLLWSVSYPNIRQAHPREDVEELADVTLDILERCTDRWPGTQAAANLYSVLSRACLQVYDAPANAPDLSVFNTPGPFPDPNEPSSAETTPVAPQTAQPAEFPHFGYVFNQQPGGGGGEGGVDPSFSFANAPFPQAGAPQGPTFRSNSIFFNPTSEDGGLGGTGRRFSHFAPDFPAGAAEEATPPATTTPVDAATPSMPTPPESITLSATVSPANPPVATPVLSQQTPAPMTSTPHTLPATPAPNRSPFPQQQPLPSAWYNPPFGAFSFPAGNALYPPDAAQPFGAPPAGPLASPFGDQFEGGFPRQGSLSLEQGTELMQTLESDGMGEIDALLNLGQGDFMW